MIQRADLMQPPTFSSWKNKLISMTTWPTKLVYFTRNWFTTTVFNHYKIVPTPNPSNHPTSSLFTTSFHKHNWITLLQGAKLLELSWKSLGRLERGTVRFVHSWQVSTVRVSDWWIRSVCTGFGSKNLNSTEQIHNSTVLIVWGRSVIGWTPPFLCSFWKKMREISL